jgi:3-isopropylmalate/(R)-2-methylmalate dehydratase large subunit
MATALQQRSGLRAAAGSRRGPLRVACVAAPPTPSRSPGSTGSVKKAMTMTEKILAKHSDKPAVVPGDNVRRGRASQSLLLAKGWPE